MAELPSHVLTKKTKKTKTKKKKKKKAKSRAVAAMVELPSHVLADIFERLPLYERLCVLPCVCSAWKRVCSHDPGCWAGKVDLQCSDLSFRSRNPDRLARFLVKDKNRGFVSFFRVPFLSSADMLLDISTSASMLRALQIPNNSLSEDTLCQLAAKFTSLTSLDLRASSVLSGECVEAFGKNCPNITDLRVNMNPVMEPCSPNDDVAIAVGKTMPQLEHLEMAYGTLSLTGLRFIMERCPKLRVLDLRGCWHVDADDAHGMEAIRRLDVFYVPTVKDDIDDWGSDLDSDSDYIYELDMDYCDVYDDCVW